MSIPDCEGVWGGGVPKHLVLATRPNLGGVTHAGFVSRSKNLQKWLKNYFLEYLKQAYAPNAPPGSATDTYMLYTLY